MPCPSQGKVSEWLSQVFQVWTTKYCVELLEFLYNSREFGINSNSACQVMMIWIRLPALTRTKGLGTTGSANLSKSEGLPHHGSMEIVNSRIGVFLLLLLLRPWLVLSIHSLRHKSLLSSQDDPEEKFHILGQLKRNATDLPSIIVLPPGISHRSESTQDHKTTSNGWITLSSQISSGWEWQAVHNRVWSRWRTRSLISLE